MIINGQNVIGAKPVFLALLNDSTISIMPDSARFLTYGLVKTFGVIGVALAFYFTAKKAKRSNLKAQLIPSTLTAVIAGITEPLEFTFIFAAPLLWFVYSVIDGLFQMFVYLLNVRVCATNGILDFLVINLPAGIGKTHWPVYILVGLVEIVVIFLVFKFMIEKMNLRTPGREENDTDAVIDLNENAAKVKQDMKSENKNNSKANNDDEKALTIIRALGGKANIVTVENCFSRLRVDVIDNTLIDEEALKGTGAAGVVKKGNNIQVVYGLSINKIRTIVDEALDRAE